MRFIMMIKANEATEAGVMPSEAGPARKLTRRARQVPRGEADGNRRTSRRGEGPGCRLLDYPGRIEGGSARLGATHPV